MKALIKFAVDVARQTVNVTAKARLVGQQTLKPSQVFAKDPNHHANVEHGKECSDADDVPLPGAKKFVTGYNAQNNQRGVNDYFDFRKLHTAHPADGYGKSLTGHGHTAATHFQGNAHAEYRATGHLRNDLEQQGVGGYPRRQEHIEVYERTKHEAYEKLEQLNGLEAATQHENLADNQNKVHDIGVLPNRQCGHLPFPTCTFKHIGQDADNARAQH